MNQAPSLGAGSGLPQVAQATAAASSGASVLAQQLRQGMWAVRTGWAGAVGAGIRAVWFNPARIPMPPQPRGVAEIHALGPLDEVLPLLVGALPRSR